MREYFKKIDSVLIILLFLILLGFYLRFVNLLFEDYWIDEMMNFWVSDPNISMSDTYDRLILRDAKPLLFSLLLKFFFKFYQYHPDAGRFFILILGTASIPLAFFVSRELNMKKSSLLFSFFICTNIYLINYSQELRPYSLLLLISFLSIFIFLRLINEHDNKKNFYIFCSLLLLVNILGFSTDPFFLIIIVSQIFHCLIKIILRESKFKIIIFITILSLIFSLLIQLDFLLSLSIDEETFWIQKADYLNLNFFTDFFFRKFFGSKIMGAIYFLTLVSLIFTFKKKIIFSSEYLIFVIIIFFSYFIPIFYGFIRTPVLLDRYIIFVLIGIFALISALIYELRSPTLRKLFISILIITTSTNLYLEFSSKGFHHKPETKKMLNSISSIYDSKDSKNIYIDQEDGAPFFFDYVVKLDEFSKNNFQMLTSNQLSLVDNFWLICYVDVCIYGDCYRDLPGEENSSCPSFKSNISKDFKLKKTIKKNNPHHKIVAKHYVK